MVRARPAEAASQKVHPIFGRYVSAWQGWAVDPAIRRSGSSGGVITALTGWLIRRKGVASVLNSGANQDAPALTVAQVVDTSAGCEASAGSRYAPVASGARLLEVLNNGAMVGKPCEVAAARAYAGVRSRDPDDTVYISFFLCGNAKSERHDILS